MYLRALCARARNLNKFRAKFRLIRSFSDFKKLDAMHYRFHSVSVHFRFGERSDRLEMELRGASDKQDSKKFSWEGTARG
jgi:hypothetical protein